jgi:hypothetical protein
VGLVVLSVTLVARGGVYKETNSSMKPSEIDIAGALFFGGFCVFTVGFSNAISKQNDLGAPGILLLIAALSAAAILLFIERRHKSPVINIEFFKNKVIRSSIISSVLAGAIMYGLVTMLPLCGVMLNKQGFKINESNILLLFMIGITTGLLTSSRLVGKLRSGHFIKLLWAVMSVSSLLLLYAINIENLILFNVLSVIIGLCTGGVMATFLINSQNAVDSKDRTVLSGLIQLGRYFGASIGVTILTGTLPQVSIISSISQFIGAFGLLVILCTLGLINEIL